MSDPEELELCTAQHAHTAAMALAQSSMPDETELADLAELFKTFGDSTRIRILCILSRTPLCVCDIAAVLGLTQPAVSYQLKILKRSRLIKSRREGKAVFYSLADRHVEIILGMAKEHLEED